MTPKETPDMANTHYIKTRCYLTNAAESLSVAYWTHDAFHVQSARESLTRALCGGDRAALVSLVQEAIADTHDIDVTDAGYARSVVDALLDYAAPLPATPEVEKDPADRSEVEG
jgi:hypothetical protein